MSVFRIHKTKNYTVMSNVHLRDRRLSLKAKGLMSLMLSLPDDWRYSIKGLSSRCSSGESAVKTGLDELSEFGYVRITKQYPSDDNSKITYSYDVFEDPGTVPEPESKQEKKSPMTSRTRRSSGFSTRAQARGSVTRRSRTASSYAVASPTDTRWRTSRPSYARKLRNGRVRRWSRTSAPRRSSHPVTSTSISTSRR